ncbi:putative oxidoreductase [Cladobotryum mycophilum]|uniref:Oxidoreductase n=1 Tax=Cladobotryum mycophilum TaxID=491253 RepID=A0ABR0SW28_9HYPO
MASKTFNVGVIGYGPPACPPKSSTSPSSPQPPPRPPLHRPALPQPGNSAPQDYPKLKHFTSAADLLADPEVDVVVITSTPDSHFELTKAALEAGKHVLTEKPFVPTSAEAGVLVEIAREKGKLICVYQNRRWDADFLLVRHLISAGTLGSVLDFNTHFDRFKAAYVLFGLPQAVRGRLLSQREGKDDFENPDAVAAELVYPDGLLVHVRISQQSVELNQPRFWVRGNKGSFRSLGLDPQEDQLKAGLAPTADGFGVLDQEGMSLVVLDAQDKPVAAPIPQLEAETYRTFYRKFGEAVVSGKEADVPVKAEEARDVLRIIEGVIESAKTGKDVTF